jgi:hypothetical protein
MKRRNVVMARSNQRLQLTGDAGNGESTCRLGARFRRWPAIVRYVVMPRRVPFAHIYALGAGLGGYCQSCSITPCVR